jgi:hypothetical protein
VAELEHLIADVMAVARYDLSENNTEQSGFQLHREPVLPGDIVAASTERFEAVGAGICLLTWNLE